MRLADRLLAIHGSLEASGVEHAFGGAIALAYWTLEPRGTRDIDVNVFARPEECESVLGSLPDGVAYSAEDVEAIRRNGQVRLWWDSTPVDLFFDNLAIHGVARRNRRRVSFEGTEIPILGPSELALFKAMFDRTRDWADIEAMLEAETLDADLLRERLADLAGEDGPRLERLGAALERSAPRRPRSTG